MARKVYDKLVRDRIPEIIAAENRACGTAIMTEDEYRQALFNKLVEEAHEAANGEPGQLVVELADLLEVVDALMLLHGISEEDVRRVQSARRAERGSFHKRIKLLWTE